MKNQLKTLTLLAGLTLATLPAFADGTHEGMHKMPDGTWMNNHEMTKAAPTQQASQAAPSGHTVVATVNGLVCDFCAQSVRKTLMKEPGVTETKVNLTAKTVTVSLKDGATLDEARLGNLLKEAGYDMTSYKAE